MIGLTAKPGGGIAVTVRGCLLSRQFLPIRLCLLYYEGVKSGEFRVGNIFFNKNFCANISVSLKFLENFPAATRSTNTETSIIQRLIKLLRSRVREVKSTYILSRSGCE